MRCHARTVLWIAILYIPCIQWGYDSLLNCILSSIPEFRRDFGYYSDEEKEYLIPPKWQLAFNSSSFLSMLVAGLLGGYISEKVGRKKTVAIGCLGSILGVSAEFWAPSPLLFLLGKSVCSFFFGFYIAIVPCFIAEISPTSVRGAAAAGINIAIVGGEFLGVSAIQVASNISSTLQTYKILIATQWFFCLLVISLVAFLPEAPYWLLSKGEEDGARRSVMRLYKCDSNEAHDHVQELLKLARGAREVQSTYLDCFRKTDRRRTFIAMGAFAIQVMSGSSFVIGYQTKFLQLMGIAISKSYTITCVNFGLMLVGNMVCMILCDRVGRRPLMICGLVILSLSYVVIGVAGNVANLEATWILTVFVGIWSFVYQVAIGGTGWALASEISTSRLRARTQAVNNMTAAILSAIVTVALPYLISRDAGNLGSNTCFIFVAATILSSVVVYYTFPELKGCSFLQVDHLFAKRIAARQFWKVARSGDWTSPDKC